jgi:hypothetical protein
MRCTIYQIYFGKEIYMFRTDLLSIIRSLNTVFTAIGIVVLLTLTASEDRMELQFHPDDARSSKCQRKIL